jgi:hypothetical protein
MNRNRPFFFNSKRIVSLSAVVLACGALVWPSQGQTPVTPVPMSDGNTTAMVDVGSDMGMYQWTVNGQNQLKQQWFWYRMGSGKQYSIDTINDPVYTQPTDNSLSTTYANDTLSVSVDYVLKDSGTGLADISESISITNRSGGSLDMHFFQYVDFNLGGTPSGDEVWAWSTGAIQQKGESGVAEGIIDPEASHFEAATTGGESSTLYRLMNNSGVTLGDSDQAAGDTTWAFQWDFSLGAGDKVDILKDKLVWTANIPEPSGTALIALGLGALGWARRRQSS